MYDVFLSVLIFLLSLFGGGEDVNEAPLQQDTPSAYPAEVTARVVRVIDGDTIDAEIGRNIERVRYIGIDTPERHEGEEPQCYSEEATAANRALVGEKEVRLVADEEQWDEYGRMLRYVYAEDTFVNKELLRAGYARLLFIPPNMHEYGNFKTIQDEARSAGRGLWSACER